MMKIFRIISGTFLTSVGLFAILGYSLIRDQAAIFSPDGVIDPHSFLQFQICLSSLGIIGLYLLFRPAFHAAVKILTNYLLLLSTMRFLTVFLTAGFVLRLAVQIFLPLRFWADCLGYEELAVNWLKMGGYYDGVLPTATWPPLYPFFLSRIYLIFGHQPQIGIFANILLNLGICYLGYRLIRIIWGEKIARLTLIILVFFPSQILFVNLLLTENLFTLLLLLSLFLFLLTKAADGNRLRQKTWFYIFTGGIVLGLASLTRAITFTFLPLLIPVWKMQTGSYKLALKNFFIALVGLLIVVAPWIIRNHYKVGVTAISSNGGVNLYLGNNPGSGMGWIPPDPNVFVLNDPAYEAHNDSVGFALGSAYIRAHPLSFVKRGVMKVAYMFAIDVDAVHYDLIRAAGEDRTDGYVVLAYIAQYYYILILLLALLGLVVFILKRPLYFNAGAGLLIMTVIYWMAVHFVFFGFGRFHFPIIPMIAGLAALYLAHKTEI
ncbi:MAG: glycosyltransferase family 39 protein [Candidatus Zixiibacteriota bacterium]